MAVIPGHPFNLGADWATALTGGSPDWDKIYDGYVAAVDWPTAMFWDELGTHYPEAPIILSRRDSAQEWYDSMSATLLPIARMAVANGWTGQGCGLTDLLERFTGTTDWDHPELLMKAYDDHLAAVRESVPAERLVDWHPQDGWEPICAALGFSVPDTPFPWRGLRSEWGFSPAS
ncbi:hypothetical protein EF847_06080 [Actinobacteria bacterium YIM 96077]|nr:hypothetical protein EF847_06080 [Actinobacteria bacterium YIM 96077]